MANQSTTNGQTVPQSVADRAAGTIPTEKVLTPFQLARAAIQETTGKKPNASYGFKTDEGAVSVSIPAKPKSRRMVDVIATAQLVGCTAKSSAPADEESDGMTESQSDKYVGEEVAPVLKRLYAAARLAMTGEAK
jgi:hypothetical protein